MNATDDEEVFVSAMVASASSDQLFAQLFLNQNDADGLSELDNETRATILNDFELDKNLQMQWLVFIFELLIF